MAFNPKRSLMYLYALRDAVAWVCFNPDTAEFLHGLSGQPASEGALDPRAQCPIFEGHPGRLSFRLQWKLSATVHLKP